MSIINPFSAHLRILNGIPLTTNVAEGYNSQLNRTLSYVKPSLACLLQALIKRQGFIEDTLVKKLVGYVDNERRCNTIEKYGRIADLINKYDDLLGNDFLKSVSSIYRWSSSRLK